MLNCKYSNDIKKKISTNVFQYNIIYFNTNKQHTNNHNIFKIMSWQVDSDNAYFVKI